MVRAHIRINTSQEAIDFVQGINSDGTTNKYILADSSGNFRANARSLLGVIYAMTDFSDHMYLVNETDDGNFPSVIDKYRM